MRRQPVVFVGMILYLLCCGGCWPYEGTTSPGVSGRVVDALTGAPLKDAEVFVSKATAEFPSNAFDPVTDQLKPGALPMPPSIDEAIRMARPPAVLTAEDGAFAIPRGKRWGIYIVPMDTFPPRGSLVIRREGYQNLLLPVSSWNVIDVGTIALKPGQP